MINNQKPNSLFKRDMSLSFSDDLAAHINRHWGMDVCMSDGSIAMDDGNVIMKSKWGVPDWLQGKYHRDIIRVSRYGNRFVVHKNGK
jgi:hypothetical protein